MPYNEDFLTLIHENSYSYLNKVKSFFQVEIGVSEKVQKSAKYMTTFIFCRIPTTNQILEKLIKFKQQ